MTERPAQARDMSDALDDELSALRACLIQGVRQPVAAEVHALLAQLRRRYEGRIKAVLLYGSTLHDADFADAVIDLYLLVDGYAGLYANALLARANRLLPPNVFYTEIRHRQRRIRCKYAIIALPQFAHGCRRWFHSYLWGRFCQPVRLVYADSVATETAVGAALAHSCYNLFSNASLAAPGTILAAEELWIKGLALSYAAELRPEDAGRARALVRRDAAYYQAVTRLLLPLFEQCYRRAAGGLCIVADARMVSRLSSAWRRRRLLGKALSLLRLAKAAYTFRDCLDYAAWKIARHTGEVIELTPRLRAHPLLFGWQVCRRLARRGVLK